MASRSVYDCFTFFNELELLELRMNVLNDYVDYFVLVESTHSFTGNKKELFYDKNKHTFDSSKIIHIVVDDMPQKKKTNNYDIAHNNEVFQRNCISRGLTKAKPDDIIIISDVDEIPDPDLIRNNEKILKRKISFSLKMKLFYFYVNYMNINNWGGSVICEYRNMRLPQKMRGKRNRRGINNGGWHYSYLGGIENVKFKVENYAMTNLNIEKYINEDNIRHSLKTGDDLFKRKRMNSRIVDINGNSPKCMNDFIIKHPHLIKCF